MGLTDWFRQLVRAINTEYERRIKRASEVTEYGHTHGHDHAASHMHTASATGPAEFEEEEVAEIVNVPRGTRLGSTSRSQSEQEITQ